MQKVVKVTRKGQTTIPASLRLELGINEGDELLAEATPQGNILLKPIPKLEDCAGIFSKYDTPEEMKKELDKIREEY